MTEHRDAGWLAQLAEKDRQIQALQAAYEDTRDSLMRALAALAEYDARYRQQVQDRAALHHKFRGTAVIESRAMRGVCFWLALVVIGVVIAVALSAFARFLGTPQWAP